MVINNHKALLRELVPLLIQNSKHSITRLVLRIVTSLFSTSGEFVSSEHPKQKQESNPRGHERTISLG